MDIFYLFITQSGEISYLVSQLIQTLHSFIIHIFFVIIFFLQMTTIFFFLMQQDQHFIIMLQSCSLLTAWHCWLVHWLPVVLDLDFGMKKTYFFFKIKKHNNCYHFIYMYRFYSFIGFCYHTLYLPFLYITFLGDFFQVIISS